MRTLWIIAFAALIAGAAGAAAANDRELPEPDKTGGDPLFKVIDRRASGGKDEFHGRVTDEELSTVLWAASGRNRGNAGWTIPVGMGNPPYCDVYVLDKTGVYLYDAEKHLLLDRSNRDVRDMVGMEEFVGGAPVIILFVMNGNKLSVLKNAEREESYGLLAVGAMSEHVYLACAALGVKTRYIASIKKTQIVRRLALPPEDKPVGLMVLGRPE